MEAKTLDISDIKGAKANIADLVVVGNGDSFQLLCKASSKSQAWMKSAKAYQIDTARWIVRRGFDSTTLGQGRRCGHM